MFKHMTTNLDTQPTTQQRLTYACQLFLIPLATCLERHLFWRTNSEPHKCVYCSQIDNMERFTWVKLAGIHLAYSAVYGSGSEAQRICNEHFWTVYDQIIVRLLLSTVAYGKLVLLQNRHSTGWGQSVRTPQFNEDVLQRFEKNPSTSTRAVGHTVSVDHCLAWNIHKQEPRPFHQQKVQALLGPIDYLHWDQFVHCFVHQSR